MNNKEFWIEKLELIPHPEGGYFKQVAQSLNTLTTKDNRERQQYTSIYFLLDAKNPSRFHRLKDDELWFFHGGTSLQVHEITSSGEYKLHKLGFNFKKGERLQVLIPGGSIFASSVESKNVYGLVSCVVVPGFDFQDFELFTQDELISQYPKHKEVIKKYAYKKIPI